MAGFTNQIVLCENIQTDANPVGTGSFNANGQLLIGGVAAPNMAVGTLTAGAGISITNGQNSISIAASVAPVAWSTISASQPLLVNAGYICIAPGGALSLSLPAASAVGDIIEVALDGATSWTVTQGAGQQIRFGNLQTTLGAGGSIASAAQGDALRLVCVTANLRWVVLSSVGVLTVV